ncbi:MAG: phosphatase PAP2 family protein, partial [Flavisolibacter sp.]
NCWKAKVVYFNERPSSFVRANINPRWTQYWPEPPFPAFPSGHSTQSAAAAIVLTSMYGDNFSFTDDSHAGAKRFSAELKFKPRHFESFWAMAEESALSRFLGGIHTRQDNAVGLEQGKKIGGNVNALLWRK